MRGRAAQSRWKFWLLMDANRWIVAGALLLGVFLSLVAASLLDLAPMRAVVASHNGLWWLFSPGINAIVTGVTLVVTINQLVLSQELGPLGDQRERMRGAVDFREDVEPWLGTETSPPDPASFLAALVDAVQTHANRLGEEVEGNEDEKLRDRVEDYVDSLTENAREVGDRLSGSQFGTFGVISTALDFNYSWKIYEARRLKSEHADSLDDATDEALADLINVLEFFGPAREHFKTLYFQWELVNLSRVMLYSSIPALVVAMVMMLYVTPDAITGSTFGIGNLVLLVSAAATVSLTPFVLLLSYILRIATVAKRTLAIGPFILRQTARSDDVDWK